MLAWPFACQRNRNSVPGALRWGEGETMKIARIFGLAVIAALALTAFSGASTASAASVFCAADPEQKPFPDESKTRCKAGTSLKSGEIVASDQAGSGVLETPSGKIECTNNTAEGTAETTGDEGAGGPQQTILKFNTVSFSGTCTTTLECKSVGAITAQTPWNATVEWESKTAPQGSVTIQEPRTTVQLNDCSIFQIDVTCVYAGNAGEKVKGTITNPNPEGTTLMQANFNKVPIKEGPTKSGLCPDEGTETVGYQIQVKNAQRQKDQTKYNGQVWLATQQHPNDKAV
jgi:hypothetical protein